MSHPDLDRLTAWVHELLEPADARDVAGHAANCAECRDLAERLHDEARVLAEEIAGGERLSALKQGLLQAPRPRSRGLLWQIPLAAAVLLGLLTVFLSPGPRHSLVAGRMALEDGREVAAPVDLAASKPWRLKAVNRASVRLSDRSTVELQPGSWIGLDARGERGVQAELAGGEFRFVVAPDPRRLTLCSSAGRVESNDGTFTVKIVVDNDEGGTPMKGLIAGALVTVLAGSASLSNAEGNVSAGPGQAAVLSRTQAPLLVAVPQDAEALLKKLEQLAARVAKLEEEIGRLETKNKQLKEQLKASPQGGVWFGGAGGGLRVNQNGNPAPGSQVIIELDENRVEKKDK